MIEIGQSKASPILDEIEPGDAGDVRESSVAIIQIKNIPFKAAPGAVRANQFVDGVPTQLVGARRLGALRRIGDHLPPEKTIEIFAAGAGDHAVGNIKIRETVVIEIPRVAGPGPAADGRFRARGVVGKFIAA